MDKTIDIPKKKPSGVCKMLQSFRYRGVNIFIRQWYDCFEFIFALGDKVYSSYIQVSDFKQAHGDKRTEVVNNMISMISNQAVTNVDAHISERSIVQKYINPITFYVGKLWHDGLQQKEPAAESSGASR